MSDCMLDCAIAAMGQVWPKIILVAPGLALISNDHNSMRTSHHTTSQLTGMHLHETQGQGAPGSNTEHQDRCRGMGQTAELDDAHMSK